MSAQQLRITLAGREHVVEAGTTAERLLVPNGTGGAGAATPVIAARVNGELRDLAAPLADGDAVEPVEIASEDGRSILRHSTAHVLAQAVQDLFPQAKLGIGPPIENGFYYDFDVPQPFGPADLDRLLDADLARRRIQLPSAAGALEADQLQLVRLTGQFGARFLIADRPAGEQLALHSS